MMDLEEYERIVPHARVDGMVFYTPNRQCLWRAQTLYEKEPDTIEWLKSMQPGETLYDVGANVGLYTVFAAKRGVKVFAFEPEAANFAVLCRNILLNELQDAAFAFPVALGERTETDFLRITSPTAGGSCHTFGRDQDYRGESKQFGFNQGCVALRMDMFGHKFGFPTHIKIDVDGLEPVVIAGGFQCINYAKSVLIEIDSTNQEHMNLYHRMIDRGFTVDQGQIDAARRKEGPFKGIGNIIFRRPE